MIPTRGLIVKNRLHPWGSSGDAAAHPLGNLPSSLDQQCRRCELEAKSLLILLRKASAWLNFEAQPWDRKILYVNHVIRRVRDWFV